MIKNIIRKWRENAKRRKERELFFRASELFQIREHEGKLWFIYNGNLICPMDMINGNGIEMLAQMRAMYLERNGVTV